MVSKYCGGEKCGICYRADPRKGKEVPAEYKVSEVIFDDDPNRGRHEYTQYVCAKCFGMIMGFTQ